MVIDCRSEFTVELVLATPYAYWLHLNGELEKVLTVKGTSPFYFFCRSVEERYTERTINNNISGLKDLPNDWLHHNASALTGRSYGELTEEERATVNGVLDYSRWTPPPLNEHYKNDRFIWNKPVVFIANSYNIEKGGPPTRYFSVECLYEMFTYLTEKGYHVVYKRPRNTEYIPDDNEKMSPSALGDICANVEGFGIMTDYDLAAQFEDVTVFNDIVQANPDLDYNTVQCMVCANIDKFISYVGGGGILCSYFGGTNIMFLSRGNEKRPGYFSEDCYYRKLSGCDIHIANDLGEVFPHKIEDYGLLLTKIKELY